MNNLQKTFNIRLLAALTFMTVLVLPMFAQAEADSVHTFRFFTGRDMFFVPTLRNGEELARLFDCVDQNRQKIADEEVLVYVDGYVNAPLATVAAKLKMAKIRSNRVKSELIVKKGLKEANFVTHNHLGDGNFVEVRLMPNPKKHPAPAPAPEPVVEEPAPEPEPVVEEPAPEPEPEITPAPVEEPVVEPEPLEVVEPDTVAVLPEVPVKEHRDSRFALKTNLLYYAALMPNIELEWMFVDRWSLALEYQYAWYAKEEPHKVYRLSTIMPEVRYWAIDRGRWHGMYVGLFGGVGMYDLCNAKTGHEGEGALGGVSVGYMWPISKHFSLDAGVGVGYLRIRDKEYLPLDGHYLYQFTKNINYIGPLRLKLSLVWRI